MNRAEFVTSMLSGGLPLRSVGPGLQRTVRQALGSGDETLQWAALGAVLRELVRQGVLRRVQIEGRPPGSAFLETATGKLLDLSPVMGAGDHQGSDDPAERAETPGGSELPAMDGVLEAMEEAQDLRLGDVQSGDVATILGNIIGMLGGFLPQFQLGILLKGSPHEGNPVRGIIHEESPDGRASWLEMREPGHAVWIPGPEELPPGMAALLPPDRFAFRKCVAVAVPVHEPPLDDQDPKGAEAGLLFVMAPESWPRDTLLKVGGRLARFVSNRWRHQRDLNLFIHTDALTGASNRAFFDKNFTLELERARRNKRPLTLVIGDIDHFKDINDTHGHQAGDRVLQMVARRLREELRRIDLVCRIGGEEFALILPDTSCEAAQEVMNRLVNARFEEKVNLDGKDVLLKATFSFGVVTFPEGGSDALELYRKADAMCYLSKDSGRNQCHCWDNMGEHLRLLPTPAASDSD